MENAANLNTLVKEIGYVLQGLLDAGYLDQFERVLCNASTDFHIHFPKDKEYFALFAENGCLKYFAFDTQEEARRQIGNWNESGDAVHYRIVSRAIAEMVGREHEYYQYREMMADSDAEAVKYACKQQEIIDFLFAAK